MKRALPLVAAIALFFAGAVVWLGKSRIVARRVFDRYSAENTSEDGLSLAARYLRRGRKVGTLTYPLAPGRVEGNAVVIRTGFLDIPRSAEEMEDEEEDEPKKEKRAAGRGARRQAGEAPARLSLTTAEEEWVRRGGRLVLAANRETSMNTTLRTAVKVFPVWPGAATLALPDSAIFETSALGRRMHVVYAAGRDTVMAREVIGKGDVIALSGPAMLTNRHLASGNHLELLEGLAGRGRPVWFDEYVHGIVSDAGALSLLREWGLGPLLMLLGLGALLLFWRNSRRIGAAEEDYRDTRSDAVDLVASVGALYDRSMSDAEAVALYHEALTRSVAAHTGLRGDALHKRVDELTNYLAVPKGEQKLPRPVFQRMLTTINDAFRALEPGGPHADHP